jgi:hypothetical protein
MELWTPIIFGAVAVVGLIEWFKSFKWAAKLKPYYNWLPFAGAIVAGLATSAYTTGDFSVAAWAVHALGILSVSVLAYKNIVELVQKKLGAITAPTPPTSQRR